MNEANMGLQKSKSESWEIYQTLCNSWSMCNKCTNLECMTFNESLRNTMSVLLNGYINVMTGSSSEGTNIISEDYGKHVHSTTPCYISDVDYMRVTGNVRVIDEGDTLPESFDNHIYCRAERGEHTTDGFRKLRIVYSPEQYLLRHFKQIQLAANINLSIEHGYISSSTLLARTVSEMGLLATNAYELQIKNDLGTQGPSEMLEVGGSAADFVRCFYVKTWAKEAESWFTRETYWPDGKLKNKIKKIGYLLVPTGNSQSRESDLEWRCSLSIAEKILFQTMTNFQRCTFVMLKALLKEYLPSDINTDGEHQLLSTYHMKTLFLWSLEDRKLVWEPEDMLDIIAYMFEKLLCWLQQQYFPHYFLPSVNLLDGRQLHGRGDILIFSISAIRNDLSNKIMQSQFFTGQESNQVNLRCPASSIDVGRLIFYRRIYHFVMKSITGTLQEEMIYYILGISDCQHINSHSMLLEGLIRIKPYKDPHLQHLYSAMYSDPVHDKLLTEVVPGLIDQYRGSIYLAKYCIAARDGRLLPGVLLTAESLLTGTLHFDPCTGYVKLACLYIATGDLLRAMHKLDKAENHFLYTYTHMEMSAIRNSQWEGVVSTIPTQIHTFFFHEVFQNWIDGNITWDIVVTWPEYITAPDLLQFELIHESKQQVVEAPVKPDDQPGKMFKFYFRIQWPPLSIIKLFKFVCTFNLGQTSKSHMENLVTDLITSSLRVSVFPGVNDIYTVFNMAAWCYIKIKKYKPAARMMTVAIGTGKGETMKRCAFSHHFLAYVIAQFLL